jgi:hypothetical protein
MANNDYENKPLNTEDIDEKRIAREDFVSEDRSDALDDEARIKVLSPTMLVMKRFFRNKLAIAGLIIIASMFLFSFVGGLISPYGEKQTFFKEEEMMKDYASGSFNREYKFDFKTEMDFSTDARAKIWCFVWVVVCHPVTDFITFPSISASRQLQLSKRKIFSFSLTFSYRTLSQIW